MKKRNFYRRGIAILTPMHEDGSINFEEFGRLIDWQIENAPTRLSSAARPANARRCRKRSISSASASARSMWPGGVPVVAGGGQQRHRLCRRDGQGMRNIGVDGLLVVTPYYNKTSQRGLVAHYTKLAEATDLPIIMYSVPSRTGVNFLPATATSCLKSRTSSRSKRQAAISSRFRKSRPSAATSWTSIPAKTESSPPSCRSAALGLSRSCPTWFPGRPMKSARSILPGTSREAPLCSFSISTW